MSEALFIAFDHDHFDPERSILLWSTSQIWRLWKKVKVGNLHVPMSNDQSPQHHENDRGGGRSPRSNKNHRERTTKKHISRENVPVDLDDFPGAYHEEDYRYVEGIPNTVYATPYDDLSTIDNDTIGHTVHPWDSLPAEQQRRFGGSYPTPNVPPQATRPRQEHQYYRYNYQHSTGHVTRDIRFQNDDDDDDDDGASLPHSKLPPQLEGDYWTGDINGHDEANYDVEMNSGGTPGKAHAKSTPVAQNPERNKDVKKDGTRRERRSTLVMLAICVGCILIATIVGATVALLLTRNKASSSSPPPQVNGTSHNLGNSPLLSSEPHSPTTFSTISPASSPHPSPLSTNRILPAQTVNPSTITLGASPSTSSPNKLSAGTSARMELPTSLPLNPANFPTSMPKGPTSKPVLAPSTLAPQALVTESPTNHPNVPTSSASPPVAASTVPSPTTQPTGAVNWIPLCCSPSSSNKEYFVNVLKRVASSQVYWNSTYNNDYLYQSTSPQGQALEWLAADPNFVNYSDERKLQRYALAVFAFGLTTSLASIMNSWLDYNTHECDWYTVASSPPCSSQSQGKEAWMQQLDLHGLGLIGTLPVEFGLLSNSLTQIYLQDNHLSGTLPAIWGPDFQSQLVRLQLTNNGDNLRGTIPPEWGQLSSMTVLGLGRNHLTGTLPNEWSTQQGGQLLALQTLGLERNSLRGTIPSDWGNGVLPSLTRLYLDENQLSGTVPDTLWRTNDASVAAPWEEIDLANNLLTGTISNVTCTISTLTVFIADCSSNGEIVCDCCTQCL